jgi:predicted nuclease of restriction endonuclease-like RecB superfamily
MTNVVYQNEPGSRENLDPDRFLRAAKQLAVDNYNRHYNPDTDAALTMDDVYIVWFAKALGNWRAIVSSNVARGLLYDISYSGHRAEVTIDVFRRINVTKAAIERL